MGDIKNSEQADLFTRRGMKFKKYIHAQKFKEDEECNKVKDEITWIKVTNKEKV